MNSASTSALHTLNTRPAQTVLLEQTLVELSVVCLKHLSPAPLAVALLQLVKQQPLEPLVSAKTQCNLNTIMV